MKTETKQKILIGIGSFALAGFAQQAAADTITHTIQPGDTLSQISVDYFGDASFMQTIADANGIQNSNLIFVGQTLTFDTDFPSVYTADNSASDASYDYVEESYTEPANSSYTSTQAPKTAESSASTSTSQSSASSTPDNWHRANRRMVESSDNYYIGSANGYIGAYQFAPSTWAATAASIGADPNDYSPENQDRLADAYAQSRYGGWSNVPTTGGW